jgi:hypothetical protein
VAAISANERWTIRLSGSIGSRVACGGGGAIAGITGASILDG